MKAKSPPRRTHPAVLALAVVFVLVAVLFVLGTVPGTLRSREAARAAYAASAIRHIHTAAAEYRRVHPEKGFPAELSDFRPVVPAQFQSAASGTANGYAFAYRATTDAKGVVAHYSISARPTKYSGDLCRSFLSDESGTIHATGENRGATPADAVLPPPE